MGAVSKYRIRRQRGISLTSIIFMIVVLGSALVLALRIVPAVVEYQSIKNAIAKAKASGNSAGEIRRAFDITAGLNDVSSIHGRDLEITREHGENQVAFEYEKRISLAGNASLLLTFSGSTDPNSTGPSKTAVANK